MKSILYIIFIFNAAIFAKGHRIQKRIALGQEAEPHSRPYQVHNVMMLRSGDVQLCGGALISPKYILTAAHCFINLSDITQTIVFMGAHNLKDQDKEYQITKTYKIHPHFEVFPEGHTKNDIALIKLDNPVELTEKIQVISLPTRSQVNNTFKGAEATEAGWGKTENQLTSDILIQGTSLIVEEEPICTYPESLLCSWSTDGHAPCVGDSGSPLVFNNTIIGVVSSGFCLAFSYYTRVTSFLDWIEENSDVKIAN